MSTPERVAMTLTPTRPAHGQTESEHTAPMSDGTELFYRAWLPPEGAQRAVILVHRGHEHSGRLRDLAAALRFPGAALFAWDARGHGRSPGVRGAAPSFGRLTRDLDEFARLVSSRHGVPPGELAVVGHSVGAVIAAAWVHDYAPPVRALVLVTPALRVRLYVPLAVPGLRLLHAVRPNAFIRSYVRSGMLTHDPEEAAAYDRDPLISRAIAVNVLLGLHDTSTRLLADAGAIRTPTLVLAAGADWVVSTRAQREFFRRLGSPVKQMETYEGCCHALLHERGRERPIARIREFLLDRFDAEPAGGIPPVAGAPPAPARGLRAAGYAAARAALQTGGRLSHGIRLGWRTGFDSGQSLDHVYADLARGTTPLGRLIDRVYLNSPGWRGIRQRRRNLDALLDRAVGELHAGGRGVRLLDIASGPGRYALECIKRHPEASITAELRDRDERGLAAGRELAAALGVRGVVYRTGDAFDPHSILTASPRPNLAVVSGLYELFPDNGPVEGSLRALHHALEERGYLVYTNQPWHPQLDFIANVLVNRDGRPWVMRCRPQAEMDALVAAAGFEKVAMETDDAAIFTVSLARKR